MDKEVVLQGLGDQSKNVCVVVFPGIVENSERAIALMGGRQRIARSHSNGNLPLEINLRPQARFSHPLFGVTQSSTNMAVVKMRIRRRRDGSDAHVASSEVVGHVRKVTSFGGLADFQMRADMLKPLKKDDRRFLSLEEIRQVKVPVLPLVLSRCDYVRDYRFRPSLADEKRRHAPTTTAEKQPKQQKQLRRVRAYVSFDAESVPTKPPEPLEALPEDDECSELEQKLKKLFQQRAVWSKNALLAHMSPEFTAVSDPKSLKWPLKIARARASAVLALLPRAAYRFQAGPWRQVWIRLGYDPRKQPESRETQLIDFRLQRRHGVALRIADQSMRFAGIPGKSGRPEQRQSGVSVKTADEEASHVDDKNFEQIEDFRFAVPPRRLGANYQVLPPFLPPPCYLLLPLLSFTPCYSVNLLTSFRPLPLAAAV
ncbi:MAG: hypothetical protein MHM6MM_000616 [Cercozoa sp. M6MM]